MDWGVAEMKAVTLHTKDGLDLLAWYRQATEPGGPILVYFCGNAGHLGYRGWKIRPFLDQGLGVLLLGYRGYNGNPGRPTEAGLYEDGRAAIRFLGAQGVRPDRIILFGESLGSAVAVENALGQKVAAVILEAPFSSVAEMGQRMFPIAPVRYLVRDRFDSLSKIARVAAPLLVLHGSNDGVVPQAMGRRLFEAAADPKEGHFIEGAGHEDIFRFGRG